MIRRGFWLVVGAAGGIIGYRRVSAVSRQVAQSLGAGAGSRDRPRARKRRWARESIRFTRDVREGMDLYFDRHQRAQDPTLGASTNASTNPSANAGAGGNAGRHALSSRGHDKREDH